MSETIDLVNRDPNSLNDHVKVQFEDIIGEPDGAHSIDCVWKGSYMCFTCCKNCCYRFMTLCCAIPISVFWGCEFAVLTFYHVWYYTPLLRIYMIECGMIQKFFETCLGCCVKPVCEAFGFCLNNIRITKE